jgi:glutamate N-acetyltransferase/amino-acid N-acetyltransferase
MGVDQRASDALAPIPGIRIGAAKAGIRQREREDLAVFELAPGTQTAAVFTRNAFVAAPVEVARRHLGAAAPRYLLINSGNANAGNGAAGVAAVEACLNAMADAVGCRADQILPFSTGVIGEPLPVERIQEALPAAFESMDSDGWAAAARAILTTDTRTKGISLVAEELEVPMRITGIAKGSGMIRPDMATMLAFIATDAAWEPDALRQALRKAVGDSFNCITVDGDTSTNDACVAMATGCASMAPITLADGQRYRYAAAALKQVCQDLALAIVRDGEGASKLVGIRVASGRSTKECRAVAETVAHSPLVKTALFAADPNWGRIVAAVGRAPLEGLDIECVSVFLEGVCVFERGRCPEAYDEAAAARVMSADEFTIRVELNRGAATATMYTCDLSYDYVRINAEYRS